jgi:hypothetical protein
MSTAISSTSKNKSSAVEVRSSRIDKAGKGLFTKQDFDGSEEIWSQKRPCKYWAKTDHPPQVKAVFDNALYRVLVQLLSLRKAGKITDQQWSTILELKGQDTGSTSTHQSEFDRQISLMVVNADQEFNVDLNTTQRLLFILKKNTFTLIAPAFDPLGAAFDPLISRANHSCSPNSYITFDGARISIRSLTPIKAGSEVTISYIDATHPIFRRQRELEERYGFICQCSVCLQGTSTWRDAFPLSKEMPKTFKEAIMKEAQDTKGPPAMKMAIAQNPGDHTNACLAATQAKAQLLLSDPDKRKSTSAIVRVQYHEEAEAFYKSSKCWPIYRQGRAEMLENLILLYIAARRFSDATKLTATLNLLVNPVHFLEPHHPIRVIRGLRLLQLLTNFRFESSHSLPFDVMLVLWELARRAVEGAKKSHGENSRLYKAICERFALEVLNMAKSMQGMSRKDVETQVNGELEKMKVWAAGEDEVEMTERSLEAMNSMGS